MAFNVNEYRRNHRAENKKRMDAGLANPPHGETNTYTEYMCRCDACKKVMHEYQQEWRAQQNDLSEKTKTWNHQTPPGSGDRNGAPWVKMDLDVALARDPQDKRRYQYTAVEAGKILGRTSMAVHQMRVKRRDPDAPETLPNVRKNLL